MEHQNREMDSPVARMFNNRSVFITGASGFIGRVLLEKLLRCYPGIQRIYILMRAKKNQQPYERLHKQLLKVPIFDQIRALDESNKSRLLDKIVVVAGDIAEPNLGISEQDMRMMLEDPSLSIIFHSAATIKFDEPLKVSVTLNLRATKTIVELCRRLPNLVSLCHVSTAYVNSDLKDNRPIEERLYPTRDQPEHLIKLAELMDENLMQSLKASLVDQRPNTYTYTKALAEQLIAQEASDLPVAIVRPSIVVAALSEPLRGWIDNLNGPTGLILAVSKGLLRTLHVTRSGKADIIPVDIVVNTMIASAFYAAKTKGKLADQQPKSIGNGLNCNGRDKMDHVRLKQSEEITQTTCETPAGAAEKCAPTLPKQPPIFHVNSGDLNPITWGRMEDHFMPIIRQYPSAQVFRYPYGSFKSSKYHDLFVRLFVHFLPALLIDMVCMWTGKKRQLMSAYHKLHSATAALSHFCLQNYNFQTKNIELLRASLSEADRRDLYMDIERLDWNSFMIDYVLGARRYVLKEPDDTLGAARKSFRRAYYIEIGLRALLLVLLAAILIPLLAPRLTTMYPIQRVLQTLNVCT